MLVLIRSLTTSPLALAGLAASIGLPTVLFGLFAGVMVDRFDRRWTMLAADIVRGIVVLALVLVRDARDVPLMMLVHFIGTVAPAIMLGSSLAHLSAERGRLGSGTLSYTDLRLTGSSVKLADSGLDIRSGRIINEGTMTQEAHGDFDLDPTGGTGIFGTIENKGAWNIAGTCSFASTGGEGVFANDGLLDLVPGVARVDMACLLRNQPGGTVRAEAGAELRLLAGSIHSPGSKLDADGGTISLVSGDHLFTGGSLTGSSHVAAQGGTITVDGAVGAASGPATGSFSLTGGTVTGSAVLSAANGFFSAGSITGNVVLRFSNNFARSANSVLSMSAGTICNDGICVETTSGTFDLDGDSAAGGGTVINNGIWRVDSGFTYSNSHGAGVFHNNGTFLSSGGFNTFRARFEQAPGSVLRVSAGELILSGGSTMQPNATLDNDGGDLYFNGDNHSLAGGNLTGSGFAFISDGVLNIDGDTGVTAGPATGGFGISGGTLGGSAMLSADHGYLGAGAITGNVELRYTGITAKIANSTISMSGGTIRNDGTLNQGYQGNFNLDTNSNDGGGTLVNNGIWNLNADLGFYNGYGGGSIINYGEFHQTGGIASVNAAFHNKGTGVISTVGNYILLQGGGTEEPGSTLNADGGSIYFNGGTHLLDGTTLTGSNWVYASSGVTSVDGNSGAASGPATGGFGITGGTVVGSAMLSADHGYISSGSIGGNVILRFTGNTTKSSNSATLMSGGMIRNDGTVNEGYQANFDLDNGSDAGGGILRNNGLWNLNADLGIYNSYGGGRFENAGILNQTGGAVSFNAVFHNLESGELNSTEGYILLQGGGSQDAGSVLNAHGGSIYFNGGTHVLNGCSLTGNTYVYASSGVVSVEGNVNETSGPATGGFGLSGGTVVGEAMLSADRGYLADGNIGGNVVLRFTGITTKPSNSVLLMSGGTILNEGTVTQGYQANFDVDNSSGAGGGTIRNWGTWTFTASGGIYNSYGGGLFENAGILNQTSGGMTVQTPFRNLASGVFNCTGGYTLFYGGGVEASGSVLNANGGSIEFCGGTHSFDGCSLIGDDYSYAVGGVISVDRNVNATAGPATGGFCMSGGTVIGSAELSADHGYLATGYIGGDVTLRFTGTTIKANNTSLYLSGGTIVNDGTLTQGYQANFDLDQDSSPGGGTLRNNGIWNLEATLGIYNSYGGGLFENANTLNQTGGGITVQAPFRNLSSGVFNCTGGYTLFYGGGVEASGSVLNANGGSIEFCGGTHSFDGCSLIGDDYSYAVGGVISVDRNVNATAGPATGGFCMSGGTVIGSAELSADHGYLATGYIGGDVTLRFTGTTIKANNTSLYLSGGTIVNDGTLTQGYQANFDLDQDSSPGGGTLRNNGIWNLEATLGIYNSNGGGLFENAGTLKNTDGTNSIHVPVVNSGSIITESGSLGLYGGSTHTGSIISNSYIGLAAGSHTMTGPAAFIGGNGGFGGNITLSNGARIAPGNSPGTLTFYYGTIDFASSGIHSAVSIDLAGSTSMDQISLGDGSVLNLGSAPVDLIPVLTFAPAFGQSFRIIDAHGTTGHFQGTFSNVPVSGSIITADYGGQSYHLQITYGSDTRHVDLTVLSPYQAWAATKGLLGNDAAFTSDPDGDDVPNGIEYVIGGEPNPNHPESNSSGLLPEMTLDETYLRVSFRRNSDARYLNPAVEFDGDLQGTWSVAVNSQQGVVITVTSNGFGTGIDRVDVAIPRNLAVDRRLFARLRANEPG
ncbi:MAG: hypothetical protein ABI600_17915 [Luteolibacter sp.]